MGAKSPRHICIAGIYREESVWFSLKYNLHTDLSTTLLQQTVGFLSSMSSDADSIAVI